MLTIVLSWFALEELYSYDSMIAHAAIGKFIWSNQFSLWRQEFGNRLKFFTELLTDSN